MKTFAGKLGTLCLAVISTHCYEIFLFLSPLLIAAAFRRAGITTEKQERIFCGMLILVFTYGFLNSAYFSINPSLPGNAGSFRRAFTQVSTYSIHFRYSVAFLATAIIAVPIKYKLYRRFIMIFTALLFGYSLIAFSVKPGMLNVQHQHSARVLLFIVPFVLGILYLISCYFNKIGSILRKSFVSSLLLISLLQLVVQAQISIQWWGYTQIFKAALISNNENVRFNRWKPVVDYRETILGQNMIDYQLVKPFNFPWTFPTMSILLAPDLKVNSIIHDKRRQDWQPFSPYSPPCIDESFGIVYAPAFLKCPE